MPADQKNFQLYTYVDDQGVSWNKRGELDAVRNAVDGSSAFGSNPNWGTESPRHRVRKMVYQDPSTFRTKTVIMYTAAAAAAVAIGTDTLSFHVEGETAAVAYTAIAIIPEKQPRAAGSRQLADHA